MYNYIIHLFKKVTVLTLTITVILLSWQWLRKRLKELCLRKCTNISIQKRNKMCHLLLGIFIDMTYFVRVL